MLPMPQYSHVERFKLISDTSSRLILSNPLYNEFNHECDAVCKHERLALRNYLDANIAHLFELSYEEFNYILSTFNIGVSQKEDILNQFISLF